MDNETKQTSVSNLNESNEAVEYNKTTRTDILQIDPRAVRVEEGFNVREDFDLDELKEMIRAQGMLKPIEVKSAGKDANGNLLYRLIDGERRLRAVLSLIEEGEPIARIQAVVAPRSTSEEELCIRQVMHNEGKRFTEYEYGKMFQRFLNKFGHTKTETARLFAKDIAFVSRCLDLLELPEEIQEQIKGKTIAVSAVREVVKNNKDDEDAQVEAVKTLVATAQANGKKTATLKDVGQEGKVLKQVSKVRLGLTQVKELLESLGENSFMFGNTAWLDNIEEALTDVRGVENEMKRLTGEQSIKVREVKTA